MKIKQLKEKTIKGLVDFLPKIGIDDIPSLRDIINNIKTTLNDKLSKSQGGEINKPITITNDKFYYSLTINPDSIYIWSKGTKKNILSVQTENTYISSQNGNIYSRYYTDNGNTTLDISGNYDEEGSGGKIRLKRTEDSKGKLSIMIDGQESSVNAEMFSSIISPNKNEVWSTDGGRINVLNLLSNAAIYVAGGRELAESGIDNTTVVDSPNRIIYDYGTGRFLARKDLICYTHWKADISKNIAPPSRYGIETDYGVFPFNNQMYKFSTRDNIFIATCSNDTCTMEELTLK